MQTVESRVRTCRLIEKMQQDPLYSKRLGLMNRSVFLKKATIKKQKQNDEDTVLL